MKKIKIWLIDIYEQRKIENRWLWATVFFYIPLLVLLLPTIISIITDLRLEYIINYICMIIASIWIIFGVVLTNMYFDNLFKLSIISKDDNNLDKIDTIDRNFGGVMNKYKYLQIVLSIIWCSMVIIVLIITKNRLMEFLRINSIIQYVFLLIYVGFTAYVQTYGYACLVMTIWILGKYYDKFVKIYNLEDCIETLSNFIFNTLIAFLSGILFFPLMFVFANGASHLVKLAVSAVVFFYVLFLLLYLFFCCFYIKNRSEKIKKDSMKKFRNDNNLIREELLKDFDNVERFTDEQRGKIIETIFNSAVINDIKDIESNPFTRNKIYITIFVLIIPLIKTFLDLKDKFNIYLEWLK